MKKLIVFISLFFSFFCLNPYLNNNISFLKSNIFIYKKINIHFQLRNINKNYNVLNFISINSIIIPSSYLNYHSLFNYFEKSKDKNNKIWYKSVKSIIIFIFLALFIIIYIIIYLRRKNKKSKFLLEELVEIRTTEILLQKHEIDFQKYEIEKAFSEMLLVNTQLNKHKEEIQKKSIKLQEQAEQLEIANMKLDKLSIVARKTDNAVTIMSKEGNYEWVNDAFIKMYGYNLKELIEKEGPSLKKPNLTDEINEKINDCLKNKKTVSYETEIDSLTRNKIWVHTTLTPIFDKEKNIKQLVTIDSDITKLKNAEEEIKNQHDDIKASIRYAQKIQQSILPIKSTLDECFENFLIYLPKDIVSGDFYWHSIVQDSIFFDEAKSLTFFAVIDCTGHGVPGAFMSVIGTNLLNEIVNEKEVLETDEILELLNKNVQKLLQQDQTDNVDGMDVCLCRFERKEKKTILNFSGAKRPLIVFIKEKNKLALIKGDRKTIGGKYYQDLNFSKREIVLSEGDTVYLTTDGFVDQNGKDRKKFGTVRFLKLLKIISKRTLEHQKNKLEFELEDHRNGIEQRDDITIVGIKI